MSFILVLIAAPVAALCVEFALAVVVMRAYRYLQRH